MSKRIFAELKIKKRVEEELAAANRMLTEKYGTDTDNATYKAHKEVLRYAWAHKVSVEEARVMMRKERDARRGEPEKSQS